MTTIQLACNFRWCVNEEINIMKESGGACPGIGNTLLPGLLADPALTKGLGDYHATPGAQNSPLHISPRRSSGRTVGYAINMMAMGYSST